jgi:aryl-alcohol dehydrogenase-like predicted oxidoreductase
MIMEIVQFGDLGLSRLMIGTVQFGMPYGIANRTGQPSYRQVCDILSTAREGGVNCLDTASMYGTSEEVLGKALAELGIASKMVIVTKTASLPPDIEPAEASRLIEESVRRSLTRLRLDTLPVCLIHHEEDFRYFDVLLELKARGLVRRVGSSVMTPGVAKGIVNSGVIDAMQVPTSLLDRRYVSAGIFHDARQRGLRLFVRSIYLQGLILMPEQDVVPGLAVVLPVLRRLRVLAADAGMTLAELAARYVLGLEGVCCGVVGVETVEQMRKNVEIFNKGPLDASLMKAVITAVPDLPDTVLMPNKWPQPAA